MKRYLIPMLMLCLMAPLTGAARERTVEFLGQWYLNPDLSALAQPDITESRKNPLADLNTQITVAGLPLPSIPKGVAPPVPGGAKDPDVLRCKSFTVTTTDLGLEFDYTDVNTEVFRAGHYRGIDTRWNNRSLRSSYQTSTRKVMQTYELAAPDQLIVTVTLRPKGGPKRTFKQVFQRTPPSEGTKPPAPQVQSAPHPKK